MSIITDIADAFGIRQTPWVVRTYITLLAACAVLMAFAIVQGGIHPSDAVNQVVSFAIDSFKVVLGACIGSLSMAANEQWGGRERRNQPTEPAENGN